MRKIVPLFLLLFCVLLSTDASAYMNPVKVRRTQYYLLASYSCKLKLLENDFRQSKSWPGQVEILQRASNFLGITLKPNPNDIFTQEQAGTACANYLNALMQKLSHEKSRDVKEYNDYVALGCVSKNILMILIGGVDNGLPSTDRRRLGVKLNQLKGFLVSAKIGKTTQKSLAKLTPQLLAARSAKDYKRAFFAFHDWDAKLTNSILVSCTK